jgi:hypothetical protein
VGCICRSEDLTSWKDFNILRRIWKSILNHREAKSHPFAEVALLFYSSERLMHNHHFISDERTIFCSNFHNVHTTGKTTRWVIRVSTVIFS